MNRYDQGWRVYSGNVYRCSVQLIPEAEGGYSVLALSLPGVASQGATEQEALKNIKEALAAVLSVYKEEGVVIPWLETPRAPEYGAKTRWVIVHVGGDHA